MKSGFVSLIGNPNVGKSTILNLLLNKKVSIVTPKAQTTRTNILAILDNSEYQIVFVDTPGMQKGKTSLDKSMLKKTLDSIKDSDLNVLVLSSNEPINESSLSSFIKRKIDIIVLNKIDLITLVEANTIKEKIKSLFPNIPLIEMSAIDGFNKEVLISEIVNKLKEGPKYYPNPEVIKDDVFYTKEIIREKILYLLQEEIPHMIAIYIKDIKHKKESVYINAQIIVNKDSHKGIVIGHRGEMIKKIGEKSRKELSKYFNKNVYLELLVKVKKDWLNSSYDLKELGY